MQKCAIPSLIIHVFNQANFFFFKNSETVLQVYKYMYIYIPYIDTVLDIFIKQKI